MLFNAKDISISYPFFLLSIFQLVVDTLLEFLVVALGSHLTPAGGAAWKKLLDTFIVVVGQEQEKIKKDQGQCSSCIIN